MPPSIHSLTSSAARTLLSLPSETCSGRRDPWSLSRPSCSRAAPSAPHTMPNRASLRQLSGPLRPVPSRSAPAGRRTESRTSSLVTEARKDILCLISGAEKPGRPWEPRSRGCRPRSGPDDGDVGDGAVRDPHLAPVQDPVVALTSRACPHPTRVIGLGEAEAADRIPAGEHEIDAGKVVGRHRRGSGGHLHFLSCAVRARGAEVGPPSRSSTAFTMSLSPRSTVSADGPSGMKLSALATRASRPS